MNKKRESSSSPSPGLPDLEPSRAAVLNSLGSLNSRRAYDYAIRMFVDWYCVEPRLGFNRSVVARYRTFLEQERYAASTINLRLGAVRRLASEAADSGPLSPDLAAGIRRVKGVKSLGSRIGNWLTTEQSRQLLIKIDLSTLKGKRDYALLSVLVGCGLRRAELIGVRVADFDRRDGHWLLPDLRGKGGHIRTVPVPQWVKNAVDRWTQAARIVEGVVFRAVDRADKVHGDGIDAKVIWTVVRSRAKACGMEHIAPHDLRSYAESRTMPNRFEE
ncbi:MAG TPA: tyrosine-type recombinase/integrase [Bryobacteraceae bacterium]|nr:tyrosine-type recombinase/integrase [Bryobacteraceae bacterium]